MGVGLRLDRVGLAPRVEPETVGGVVDELCSPDLVEHQFGMAGRGAEALDHLREAMGQVHAAIPDIAFTVEDAVQSGDTLWARVTGRGTATGPFFGPTSRSMWSSTAWADC